ncbi:MAG TPA: hypothetical protein VKY44_09485 [Flavobacterium sp.]|nr:hypothetical protein [Flavobacterium sp.]
MKRNFFFIITIVFLFGCASKQERAEKFLNENPSYFAQLCAINFPITEKIVPGKPVIDTVTVTLPGVEIPCPEYTDENGQKQQPKIKCPDAETKYITKFKTDTIYKENTANVIRLQTDNLVLKQQNKDLEDKKSNLNKMILMWKLIATGIALLFFGSIYIHFKR